MGTPLPSINCGYIFCEAQDIIELGKKKTTLVLINPEEISMPTPEKEVTLTLGGLHCAACVARVERALDRRPPGWTLALVNLATRQAKVRYNPQATNVEALSAAVKRRATKWKRRAGSSARPARPRPRPAVPEQALPAGPDPEPAGLGLHDSAGGAQPGPLRASRAMISSC